jgi:glycogen operon protein
MIALRAEHPVFRRRRFFHGRALHGNVPEVACLDPSGKEMTAEAWNAGFVRCLGVQLFGGPIDADERGAEISGDTFLMLFNADHGNKIPFTLPDPRVGGPWEFVFDTAREGTGDAAGEQPVPAAGGTYELAPCSMAVFVARVEKGEAA